MMQPDYYEVLQALPALKADSKHPPGPKLVLHDNVYTISRRCKNHIMWKCRVEGCKGTAKSTLEYTAPVIYTQHSAHPPNRAKADLVIIINKPLCSLITIVINEPHSCISFNMIFLNNKNV